MRTLGILAGGFGTRLRSVVADVPKPMAPIGQIPFLDYLIREWIHLDNSIGEILISVGYKRNIIQNYFGDTFHGIPVNYVIEERPLGTGGAALAIIQHCDQSLYLLNGDSWLIPPYDFLSAFFIDDIPSIQILLRAVEKKDRYGGVELCNGGLISKFCSESQSTRFVNGGVYGFSCGAIKELKQLIVNRQFGVENCPLSLENELFPNLLAGKKITLKGVLVDRPFLDIGIPGDYAKAADFIVRNKRG